MKAILLALAAVAAVVFPVLVDAQNAPRPGGVPDRASIEEAQRAQSMRRQQENDLRIQRARDRCIANRGTDCDSMAGLEEWLLLDRTRAEAVLDRIGTIPAQGSASAGSSLAPGVPELSPYNR